MREHTPGPWKLEAGRSFQTQSGTFYLAYGRDEKTNAPYFSPPTELDANARLIAAAPDLLAALEYYLEGEPGPEYVAYRSPKAVREKARAAIAKAKRQTD